MAPVLNCHPGSLNVFALKLKPTDTVSSLKARIARKLAVPDEGSEISIKYLWCDVFYTLDDDDDFEVFLSRHSHSPEVTLLLSSPHIPTKNPSIASLSSLPSSSSPAKADSSSLYSEGGRSAMLYGRQDTRELRNGTSMHLVVSSSSNAPESVKSGRSGGSTIGPKSTKKGASGTKSLAPSVPEHKIKFEEFHNQLGVRTFIGSIGPVENVRMMMKSGHRHCYMSRTFALQHSFIPADAAPGFYGFGGITDLGVWPIKVGTKTVEQRVMLVENSYFPVILGRSFMERRGVRTDPLDPTRVVFMDTNEVVPTDLVVVKDRDGSVVPIS
ncbi:hypothetical protein NBRC10512_003750 [Rhodotorula toruloides]|uniref:RHTO0S03e12992g1_1 n=2 Tax=Rhodotorula toruloides TaxID=5286 RepID=A0A061AMC8_RHOTO|nr:uncharacterized protein RHTO_00609 [Rhodotorula toruloides NP11]EMS26181.1 hypothetical protein RHTO_00609 [Rhodotorula toruloides NP11]CDR38764.1 RHTO0S03e12992g1_1 [Rhodotorula toruloides]